MLVREHYPWVLSEFGEAKEQSNGLYVDTPCPIKCHRTSVVRWWVYGDVKALCFKCWAGCPKLEILRSVGRGWKDCFPADTDWRKYQPKQEVTAKYPYYDESGIVLYEVLRLEPGRRGKDKDFRQRRRDPSAKGGWVYEMGDVRKVLYRLWDIITQPTEGVFVVAGEKDVDSLRRIGVLATTNVGGENAEWLDSYSQSLAGRDVIVVEDRDSAGRRHAHEVVGSLIANGVGSVGRLALPDAKDATEFLMKKRAAMEQPDGMSKAAWDRRVKCDLVSEWESVMAEVKNWRSV